MPFASKRRGKRRIAFASERLFPYHAPTLIVDEIASVNDVLDLPEMTFDLNKEHMCVGCAKELQVGTLQGWFYLSVFFFGFVDSPPPHPTKRKMAGSTSDL